VLTSEGLTAFVNGSHSWGRPGTAALELLEFKTRSTTGEAGMSYPVIRARERNLTLSGLAFMSDSHSDILSEPFNEDRLRGLRLKADADVADSFGGINQFNFTFSQGFKGFGSTENGNPLASRAAGRVNFNKVEGYASRLQPLFASLSAQLAAYGQYAFVPLLSPEQCGYGGSRFGRAFDPSQLIGDQCWQLSGELRYDFPALGNLPAQVQLYGFTDYGKLYTIGAATGTAASVSGASAGGGVRLGWQNYVNVDLSVAKAIEGARNDRRFFFTVTARN
jgi:hemolysin activation/secretion protein